MEEEEEDMEVVRNTLMVCFASVKEVSGSSCISAKKKSARPYAGNRYS